VAWVFGVALGITGPLFFLTPLLFPDGRPPSPRWRPVVWVAVAGGLGAAVCAALSNVEYSSNFPNLRDPVTVVAPLTTAYNLSQEVTQLVLVAGVVSMFVRFRRSGTEQRLQLKWFMYASAVAGLVLLATGVLRLHSTVAVAAATLAAAALFNPLRVRVQRMVDRRFNRARYDADQTVAAFAARLQDAVDLDSIREDLAGVIHQALEPSHISVWVSRRD
jgi:hypothetical protein